MEADWIFAEAQGGYSNEFLKERELPYQVIGICVEVHRELGRGFKEIIYKDAIEYELKRKNISFEREKYYEVQYKDIVLKHTYQANFVINDEIILEVKAQQRIIEDHYTQVINYLAISKCQLGLIVNFAEMSLQYKRVILTK